jgi:hypothetical protein
MKNKIVVDKSLKKPNPLIWELLAEFILKEKLALP